MTENAKQAAYAAARRAYTGPAAASIKAEHDAAQLADRARAEALAVDAELAAADAPADPAKGKPDAD